MVIKNGIDDLALFSGRSEFAYPLHVGKPNIGNKENFLKRVSEILDDRRLTNNGPRVKELEQKIAAFLNVKHVISMSNGTTALEILIRALDLKGEVILPSFTFVACAHALQWQGITPVFADIDQNTHLIDPLKIERMITPNTTGIMGVHLWGRPCNVEYLAKLARRYELALFFDASHAFGVSYRGRMLGGFGAAEVFSFHATKFFNTFEGGAAATTNS